MIPKLLFSFKNAVGMLLSIILMAGYVYYSHQGGPPSLPTTATKPVPQALESAVDSLCRDIAGQLPEPERAMKPLLLLPLNGDRENLLTDRLRVSLDRQGWYRPVEANLLEKVLGTTKELTGFGSDPSVRSMQWSPAELANMMRSAKAEAVLRGSVDRLAIPEAGPVEIKLRLELWEMPPSEPTVAVLMRSLDLERPLPLSAGVSDPGGWNRIRPYGISILIALVWPFAMIPWMKKATRKDSNTAILKALLGMTAIPLTAFLLYLICLGKGGFDIVLQCGIVALFLFFYTAFVLNGVQEKVR